MKKQMILTAVAVSALLGACTKENTSGLADNAIEFRTLIDKTTGNRASLVDKTEHLTNFFVAGGVAVSPYTLDFMQAAVWREGTSGSYTWTYAPKKYFPADGTAVNFFAYAPIKDVNMDGDAELNIDSSTGKVSFDYTVPFDQSASNTAVDLLVAYASGQTFTGSAVSFAFNHALSGVTFSAKNNNPVESELVYIVSGIEISALSTKGTFTYPSTWNDLSSKEAYIPGLPASGVSLMPKGTAGSFVNLLSANDIMMVMPQETTPGTEIGGILATEPINWKSASYVKIVFSAKYGDGSFMYENSSLYLPLPDDFEFVSGTLYDFQFQFAASDAVEFKVTGLTNWSTPAVTPIPAPQP